MVPAPHTQPADAHSPINSKLHYGLASVVLRGGSLTWLVGRESVNVFTHTEIAVIVQNKTASHLERVGAHYCHPLLQPRGALI